MQHGIMNNKRRVGFYPFNQTNRSDRDQIFKVFSGIVEFFDDMNMNLCKEAAEYTLNNPRIGVNQRMPPPTPVSKV